ncbi:MAG: hypothetical protein KC464_23720, partial [Myxococcales bacterium]|nr:hypothetical protein [Myxococcales bacterium]
VDGTDVIERAVFADPARLLFGVLSTPATRAPSGHGILLLNAGAIHRIGPNRLYTVMARRWAALGHTVLRLDITGIGDSPPRPGEPENVVYSPRALEDVAEALAFLQRQPGVGDCRAVGLCSGAYHAFKAAVAGQPVAGVVVINPLTFFWKPGQSLDYPAHRVVGDAERYGKSAADLEKWKKLLRGQVDVRKVAQTLSRHLARRLTDRARDLSRRVGMPWREDLGAELETIADRNVDLRFVFATGDPGLPLLRAQGGSAVPALRGRGQLAIDMIDGPDHTFTPVWSHPQLINVLAVVLDAPTRPSR